MNTAAPPKRSKPKLRSERHDERARSSRRGGAGIVGGVPQKLFTWDEIFVRAPTMAATMARYLDQLRVSARPATVRAYDDALRMFAGQITSVDPACRSVAVIEHRHVEAHKSWMASRPGRNGRGKLSATTISHRLCLLRTFFERIIDWDYDDAPRRSPVYAG